jgi:hypothetical protein
LNPDLPLAFEKRAEAYRVQGDADRADADLAKARRLRGGE